MASKVVGRYRTVVRPLRGNSKVDNVRRCPFVAYGSERAKDLQGAQLATLGVIRSRAVRRIRDIALSRVVWLEQRPSQFPNPAVSALQAFKYDIRGESRIPTTPAKNIYSSTIMNFESKSYLIQALLLFLHI